MVIPTFPLDPGTAPSTQTRTLDSRTQSRLPRSFVPSDSDQAVCRVVRSDCSTPASSMTMRLPVTFCGGGENRASAALLSVSMVTRSADPFCNPVSAPGCRR